MSGRRERAHRSFEGRRRDQVQGRRFPGRQRDDRTKPLGRQKDTRGTAPEPGRNVFARRVSRVHAHQLRLERQAEHLRIARAVRPGDGAPLEGAVDVDVPIRHQLRPRVDRRHHDQVPSLGVDHLARTNRLDNDQRSAPGNVHRRRRLRHLAARGRSGFPDSGADGRRRRRDGDAAAFQLGDARPPPLDGRVLVSRACGRAPARRPPGGGRWQPRPRRGPGARRARPSSRWRTGYPRSTDRRFSDVERARQHSAGLDTVVGS